MGLLLGLLRVARVMSETDDGGETCGVAPRSVADGGREPIDRILLALSEPRCRYLLYYLQGEGDVYIEDVARFIAACERDCDPDDVPEDHYDRVRRDLYHVHLPKLAAEGVVEYDRDDGVARFDDDCERFGRYLAAAADDEDEPLRRRPDDPTLSEF